MAAARRLALLSATTLAILLRASTSFAGPPASKPQAATAPRDAADDWFDRGTAAYAAHKLAEAETAFAEAWKLKKTQDIAANLGTVELELGKPRRAAEHLAWAVQHAAPTDSDAARLATRRRFDKARAQVGALRVQVNQPGARVFVNDEPVGQAPLDAEVFTDTGTATVVARLDGYADARAVVQVEKGSAQDVSLKLDPIQAPKRSAVPAVVLGAGSAAFLVSGIVFTVVSNSKASSADAKLTELQATFGKAPCLAAKAATPCTTLHDLNQSSDTFHNLAVAGFVVAGAAAVAAITYAAWPAKKQEPRVGLRVAPVVGDRMGGLAIGGEF